MVFVTPENLGEYEEFFSLEEENEAVQVSFSVIPASRWRESILVSFSRLRSRRWIPATNRGYDDRVLIGAALVLH